ncbi:hypothetical protein TARUN_3894 [Trichoderma arundinaceum]|uniref:Uncharacterized protein n=1 Tax=Trichoderma arundinaceum TaxID=490622 RepID=A0A395NQN3_TRIAR|nr:hypothetical protein TARUN_3894 [Trichoderma arundinaceum]
MDPPGVQGWGKHVTQGATNGHIDMLPASVANNEETVPDPSDPATLWQLQSSRPQKGKLSLAQSITLQHPLVHIAEKHVRLPVSRLDYLFKSEAFRYAPNPIFDGSHVDAALNMRAVLPQCEDEPIFLNALVFSIIQIINRGNLMVEGLSLQGRIVRLMKRKFTSRTENISPGVIGAIMLLKSTAYRTRNIVAHDVHTRGLADTLNLANRNGNGLTPAALRATFWLDLNAAVVLDSKRQMSHLDLPQKVSWQREGCLQLWHLLPAGFARYRHTLPFELLACIVDIVELQTTLLAGDMSPHACKFHEIDAMQASIESRLTFLAQECRQHGAVAEAVRLGVGRNAA